MSYVINDPNDAVSEADIDTKTGAITTIGPLTVTGLQVGTVILAAQWDATLNGGDGGWRLLILNPK